MRPIGMYLARAVRSSMIIFAVLALPAGMVQAKGGHGGGHHGGGHHGGGGGHHGGGRGHHGGGGGHHAGGFGHHGGGGGHRGGGHGGGAAHRGAALHHTATAHHAASAGRPFMNRGGAAVLAHASYNRNAFGNRAGLNRTALNNGRSFSGAGARSNIGVAANAINGNGGSRYGLGQWGYSGSGYRNRNLVEVYLPGFGWVRVPIQAIRRF